MLELRDALRGSFPPGHSVINTLQLVITTGLRRDFHALLSVDQIAHTDWNLSQFIEHIQLGDHQPGDAVNHASVAQQRQVEPAGAPRSPCYCPILVAALAKLLTQFTFLLAGKRTFADARAICLG